MKNILLYTTLIAIFAFNAYSIPELNVNSIPKIGSSFVQYECDTTGISDGTAGSNQTWDYSNLVLNEDESPMMFTVESPENGERYEEFTNADFAQVFSDGSIFYKLNGSKLERLGVGYSEGTEKLNDLSTIMEYPFSYDDSFDDKFSGVIVSSDGEDEYTLEREGSLYMIADGYGTLIMPFGTFNNVLRVKIIEQVDDSFVLVTGMDPMISHDYNISYSYFIESNTFPILTITHSILSYENYPYPIEDEYFNDVSYIEFDAVITEKPTVPNMYSPVNYATNVDLPVTLWWEESDLSGITRKNNDKTQEEIMYTVQVSSNPTFVGMIEIENKTSETNSEITDLELGKTYYWRVMAEYKDEASEWSEPWEFSVAEEQVEYPDPPSLLSPENGAKDVSLMPTFSWSGNEDISEWEFMMTISTVDGDSLVYYETALTKPEFTVTNELNGNTSYLWKSRGYDGNNWSEWSEPFEFTTMDPTSVSEILNANDVAINPNPVNSVINLTFNSLVNSNANVSIIDLSGNTVFASENLMITVGANSMALDVNKLSSGMYFLIINGMNFNLSHKIVINK